MVSRVYFRGNRAEARAMARRLTLMLVGHLPDQNGVARGVFLAMGFAALSDIKTDFVRKARGETGEDGNRWAPLSPKTLAYGRRFGRGEQAALKREAGLGRGHTRAPGGNRGLLTATQLKRWKAIFASRLARFAVSMPIGEAKGKAAAIAWATLKREGAKTKLEVFGNRKVEVLRDTGVLLNSLSPGYLGGPGSTADYRKPSGPGGDMQVFEALRNGVVVGTTVPYAGTHQNGDSKRKIPARPFLPAPGQEPDVWLERWANAGSKALEVGARMIFEAA